MMPRAVRAEQREPGSIVGGARTTMASRRTASPTAMWLTSGCLNDAGVAGGMASSATHPSHWHSIVQRPCRHGWLRSECAHTNAVASTIRRHVAKSATGGLGLRVSRAPEYCEGEGWHAAGGQEQRYSEALPGSV